MPPASRPEPASRSRSSDSKTAGAPGTRAFAVSAARSPKSRMASGRQRASDAMSAMPVAPRGSRAPRSRRASGLDLPDLDEFEPQLPDELEHAVERGLVEMRAVQDRLGRLEVCVQSVEARENRVADPTPNADLVVAFAHHLPESASGAVG